MSALRVLPYAHFSVNHHFTVTGDFYQPLVIERPFHSPLVAVISC